MVSEYVGRGPLAEAAAALDESKRLAREEERELVEREREQQRAIDEAVDRACRLVGTLVEGALLLNRYYYHKGEWRLRRE